MCLFKSSAPARTCNQVIEVGLSQKEIEEIVHKHNHLRAKVALGKEQRGLPGPQPRATNMKKLKWDNELAAIAQRWANQCKFQHDLCRDTPSERVGQNLAIASSTAQTFKPVQHLIQGWYDEVQYFNARDVDQFKSGNAQLSNGEVKMVGHYTQLVWGDSDRIGCGAIKYKDAQGWYSFYLACNYASAGNFLGSPVYDRA
ncbi:venom allergen 3 homolog [Prorops nasuta]|uniref:venom allergen 3 homolog n=1 Tax=Prorops nasuta TaxID=863751 RepID=UPI0034CD0A3A